MTKKRKPKPDAQLVTDFMGWTVADLETASIDAGADVNAARREYQLAQSRFASIRHAINMHFLNGKMGISDHAVIRYLERCKGMDIEAIRDEIRALAAPYKDGETVPFDNGCHGVLFEGHMMTTVLSPDMRKKRTRVNNNVADVVQEKDTVTK